MVRGLSLKKGQPMLRDIFDGLCTLVGVAGILVLSWGMM